jgi:hypothetical protein
MSDETLKWSRDKNLWLQKERGLSFEDVENAIEGGGFRDDIAHPDPKKFPGQRLLIVEIGEQICVVPYVTDGRVRFLKTIYPSRKAKRIYGKAQNDE